MTRVLVAIVAAGLWACTAPIQEHGLDATTPFLFVSLIGSHAGGMPASSRTFYVGWDGRFLTADESTDGTLRHLRQTTQSSASLFEDLAAVAASQANDPAPTPDASQLTDFYPDKVAVAWLTPAGQYRIESHRRLDKSSSLGALVDRVIALGESESLVDSAPGLYVRAQRIPGFDPLVQTADLALTRQQLKDASSVIAALKQEMAWVRIGEPGGPVRIAEAVEFRPGRPVHVGIDDSVYRFITFTTIERSDMED